jgi:hypothetical protein
MSAVPSALTRVTSFTQNAVTGQSYSPTDLDAEFNRIMAKVNEIISRSLEIQRDDGALKNGIVTNDSIAITSTFVYGFGTY